MVIETVAIQQWRLGDLGVFARVVFGNSSGGGLLLDPIGEDCPLDELGQHG
jgi:hypothetical protein